MKCISKILVLCFLMISLSGCGTVNGVGQDVSSVGHGMERAAHGG